MSESETNDPTTKSTAPTTSVAKSKSGSASRNGTARKATVKAKSATAAKSTTARKTTATKAKTAGSTRTRRTATKAGTVSKKRSSGSVNAVERAAYITMGASQRAAEIVSDGISPKGARRNVDRLQRSLKSSMADCEKQGRATGIDLIGLQEQTIKQAREGRRLIESRVRSRRGTMMSDIDSAAKRVRETIKQGFAVGEGLVSRVKR